MEHSIIDMTQFAIPWLITGSMFYLWYIMSYLPMINNKLSLCEISNIEIYGSPRHPTPSRQTQDLLSQMMTNAKRWRRRHALWLTVQLLSLHVFLIGAYSALASGVYQAMADNVAGSVLGFAAGAAFLGGMTCAWRTVLRLRENRQRIGNILLELSRMQNPVTVQTVVGIPLRDRLVQLGHAVAALLPVSAGAGFIRRFRSSWTVDSSAASEARSVNVFPLPLTHEH